MGLGSFDGGLAAARFVAVHGAKLTVTDLRERDELHEACDQLELDGIPTKWFLGSHPPEAFDCDLLIVNPAVRPHHPLVERCRTAGIPVTSEIELFVGNQSAQLIAVTGTNGKSTTVSLIADLLRRTSPRRPVWTGGNIGNSLLPKLDRIAPGDTVVLELSSFQLYQLQHCSFRPDISVVTNVQPNHLNWHPDLDHYQTCKRVVCAEQSDRDTTVLPSSFDLFTPTAHCLRFGQDCGEDGVFYEDGSLIYRQGDQESAINAGLPATFRLPHQIENLTAAVAAAQAARPEVDLIGEVHHTFTSYRGLPHRLQQVAVVQGRCFVDDSAATTPESTIAALSAYAPRCVLLAGGAEKNVDLTALCHAIAQQLHGFIAMGETGADMEAAVQDLRGTADFPIIRRADNFDDAFREAVALSRTGDIVLLSPGCSSQDWFRDFRHRGQTFSRLANKLKQTRPDQR